MGNGASKGQTDIAASQKNFASSLQADFGTAFAGQQNILNGLTKSLTSTLAGGPSQFGFSEPENTAMKTLATSANSQAYQNAKAAAGEAAAAAGGGGAVLPTGSQGQTQADLALKTAQNQSNSLLGIQEAGYKQGNANYNEAVSGLQGTASLENPNGLASNANSAGNDAFNSATTIQKTNAAASPWAQVGGLVGSLGGAALNAFVPGAGALGKISNPMSGTSAASLGGLGNAPGGNINMSGLGSSPDLSMFNTSYNVGQG
jgi:hypothetical protein